MDYRYSSWDPRYRRQLVDLFGRVFGGEPVQNEAYFRWKYEQNPYLPEPLFAIALEGERVVGMRGFYGGSWTAGSGTAPLVVPAGADTAVDPDHRGRWIFEGMMEHAIGELRARGFEYAFNFSANRSVQVLSQRAGWRKLLRYDAWQLRPEPSALRVWSDRAARKLRRRVGRAAPELARLDRRFASPRQGVSVASQPRPVEMAALVADTRAGRLGHLRDDAFYGWRFRDPGSDYRFLFLERGGNLDGFFALEQRRRGGWINILDWAVRDAEATRRLLEATLVSGAEVQIWSATLPAAFLEELRAAGFALGAAGAPGRPANPQGPFITATDDRPSEDWAIEGLPLLDADRWDLRMAYSDAH
jgi:GNAT superfamily N-acetyltransferase